MVAVYSRRRLGNILGRVDRDDSSDASDWRRHRRGLWISRRRARRCRHQQQIHERCRVDLKGFGLKVSPAGSKVYLVQYRLGGREARTQRYTIGKHGSSWTPDKAREEAGRLLGRVANESIRPRRGRRTLPRTGPMRRPQRLPNSRPATSMSTPSPTRNPHRRGGRAQPSPAYQAGACQAEAQGHNPGPHHEIPRQRERHADKRQPLPCAALTPVKDGRGLGRAPAGIEPVSIRRKIRRTKTGAVSLGGRARSSGGRAGGRRRQGATISHRRDPTADPHGVPSVGDPVASVGMDRFRARLPDAARQQDRGKNRAAWGTRASRAGRVAATGGQPVRSACRARRRTLRRHPGNASGGRPDSTMSAFMTSGTASPRSPYRAATASTSSARYLGIVNHEPPSATPI
jgi:hypothetical protein